MNRPDIRLYQWMQHPALRAAAQAVTQPLPAVHVRDDGNEGKRVMARKNYGPPVYRTVQGEMGRWESLLHALLTVGTLGLWLPVYWIRRRKIRRTATTYAMPPNRPQP